MIGTLVIAVLEISLSGATDLPILYEIFIGLFNCEHDFEQFNSSSTVHRYLNSRDQNNSRRCGHKDLI